MSSGNTYGLAGISHFGSMQRVGGKAAGFINKKFFHPSSLRNQEKLWLAMTAHEVETKKQDEQDKRREEEMQVEELKRQMYLQGQATKGTDALTGLASRVSIAPANMTKEQKEAYETQRQRKSLLKEQHQAEAANALKQEGEEGSDVEVGDTSAAPVNEAELMASLAKSCYKEDLVEKGHQKVWGSWYAKEEARWGYICCKSLERNKRCSFAPEEEEEKPRTRQERGRGKRRRKGGAAAADGTAGEAAQEGQAQPPATSSSAPASNSTAPPPDPGKGADDTATTSKEDAADAARGTSLPESTATAGVEPAAPAGVTPAASSTASPAAEMPATAADGKPFMTAEAFQQMAATQAGSSAAAKATSTDADDAPPSS